MFEVDGKQLSDFTNEDPVKMRNQILFNLKLAIADIGFRVLRQKNSSKDQNLFPIEYTDIFTILDTNPEINKIIITSSSGGNSVLSWFQHYCELNKHSFKVPSAKLPLSTSLSFKNKRIKIDIISSPSRLSPIKGDKLIQMYKDALAD